MTHLGSMITAKSVGLIVNFKQEFKNRYLCESYSPIDVDTMVSEIEHVNCKAFEIYLNQLSAHRAEQYKILVIDNAGFHSKKNSYF